MHLAADVPCIWLLVYRASGCWCTVHLAAGVPCIWLLVYRALKPLMLLYAEGFRGVGEGYAIIHTVTVSTDSTVTDVPLS